jgi:hypothetical protein
MDDATKKAKMKSVFTTIPYGPDGKKKWMNVGTGFVNEDGSISLKLDALPINGQLTVRAYQTREEREAFFAQRAAQRNGAATHAAE